MVKFFLNLRQGIMLISDGLPLPVAACQFEFLIDLFDLFVKVHALVHGIRVVFGNLSKDGHLIQNFLFDCVVQVGNGVKHWGCVLGDR